MRPAVTTPARLAVSVGLAAAYLGGHVVELPFVDHAAVASLRQLVPNSAALSVMKVSWEPFLISFLVVEILSFVVPPLRVARSSGVPGRHRLNRYALAGGLVLAAAQSLALARHLFRATSLTGTPLVSGGTLVYAALVAILFSGSTACYLIAEAISSAGLGNGFAWLALVDALWPSIREVLNAADASVYIPALVPTLLFALAAHALLTRGSKMTVRLDDGAEVQVERPPLPQGLLPLSVAFMVTTLLVKTVYDWPAVTLLILVLLVLSGGGWALFSSRRRIDTALAGQGAPAAGSASLRESLLPVVLACIATVSVPGLAILSSGQYFVLLSMPSLLLVVAVLTDLKDEWVFRKGHGALAHLIDLDNVHLASLIRSLARDAGFDVLVRSLRLRQLFFFLGPIYKMAVLVPSEAEHEAHQWLESLDLRTPWLPAVPIAAGGARAADLAPAERRVHRRRAVEVDPPDVAPGHVLGALPAVDEDQHAGVPLAEVAARSSWSSSPLLEGHPGALGPGAGRLAAGGHDRGDQAEGNGVVSRPGTGRRGCRWSRSRRGRRPAGRRGGGRRGW